MARIVLPEAKIFKEIIGAVGKLADEVALNITREGISIKALDIDQSSYIEIVLPSDMFLEYTVENEEVVGISTSNIKKVLKHLRKGENLTIETSGEYVGFTVGTVTKRRYRFRNIDVAVPEIPEFNLDFKVTAQLTSSGVKKAIEDVESVGSVIEVDASSDTLVFRAVGSSRAEVRFTQGSPALISLEVREPSKSTYDVVKLATVLGVAEMSDMVTLGFSSKMPLKMEFHIGSGRITYLTAPIEVG
ncbi:DNA polymerase sliding clamp [Desulfurococcus mucosus]|uniref:DNA polymerase sliding clamp n=1 Tax=Desulfurococcus mucosus (strain ATCC 35584 / DSM 2162 / JCM 9187 / O7/1) TaxID=765177 RepID=E8R961_DESM0|nr:DNA polymerase sliding clamp [Desulfurococcus mucosus]ADV65037.1 DNA polymerase sliding clamp subunit A [Desulfurococcus mucosus DSM 2162]